MILRPPASLDIRSPLLPSAHPPAGQSLHLRCKRRRWRPVQGSLPDALQSIVPLDLIAPALGFASGAALFLSSHSRRLSASNAAAAVAGNWILYSSPTPFNRAVLLRCPSVSFEGGGERLVKEERHNVNLNLLAEDGGAGDGVSYQRVCVGTEDGGVISLDWPEDLDMGKEHGLDTTVLIVPGTVEGSMDRDVRRFVCDALMNGCFPIVVNPRGCAGSPLTTARLFTAADSDDICAAVQFINKSRPWTTLMGVGWGYGANMLTKYLAEVGVKTPLTAAVCIDNPFDLEEATGSFTTHTAFNPKLRSGLIDILRTNKELFQGKAKGFDVAKALSAKSIRDFDEAISMVSYGFSDISDFYSKTSTGQLVSCVKIPVLFIQSVDSTVSALSVSRSSIAENPFTSLLLFSCLPSTISRSERSAIHWCQHIAIEWLSAVEFALLKGRHPLLKDVDITINPSKGPTFIDGIASERSISKGSKAQGFYKPNQMNYGQKNINGDAFMKLTQSNSVSGFLIDALAVKDGAVQDKVNHHPKPGTELYGLQRKDVGRKQDGKGDIPRESDSLAKEESDIPIDSEGSQVLQTATIVMNMLNVTMPGVLEDEQKKKVLSAMERGETLMKALEGAVPDEVRGKLTTAATEILQTQGTKLHLDGLKRIGWNPNVASEVTSRIQEKLKGISTRENGHETLKSDQRATGTGTEGITQDDSVLVGNSSKQESIVSSQEKAEQVSGSVEAGSEEEIKQREDTKFEKSSTDGEEGSDEFEANQSNEMTNRPSVSDQAVVNDINDVQINDGKKMDSVAEQNIPASNTSSDEEIPAVPSTTEQQGVQKDGTEVQKNDGKMVQDAVNHVQSKPPSISVSQALDAITGFDDSTQMAVNSVFGVLENMIDQFEKSSNQEADEESNKKDQESVDVSHELPPVNEDKSEKILNGNNKSSVESDIIHASDQKETSFHVNGSDSRGKTDGNRDVNQESKVGSSFSSSAKYSISRFPEKIPVKVAVSPHWASPYGTYFRRYLSAQLPINGSIDLDSATDLFLDPEEGQWKMLNQAGNTKSDRDESGEKQRVNIFSRQDEDEDEDEDVIEPSYVILDSEHSGHDYQLNEECDTRGYSKREHDAETENLLCLIRDAVMDSLKTEICRRSGMLDFSELDSDLVDDLEYVSDTVSRAVVRDTELKLNQLPKHIDDTSIKLGTIDGENVTRTISSALQEANHLRKVVPVGVVVGTCLALLRNYFEVAAVHDDGNRGKAISESVTMDTFQEGHIKTKSHRAGLNNLNENSENIGTESLNNDRIMVGAVTAALGASVLLANHQHTQAYKHENSGNPSGSYNGKGFAEMEHGEMQEKNQIGLVGSLAEKAMSVAAPVVPTKSDGGVDQDRLVAILAELGQRGGILRLVGKLALLWGGVRGAMSLTEKLISFLHIAERPLFQRILGFVGMVLVLWTPVVIPLLPTLVQNWTTNTSNGMAQSACIVGLYIAIMFLVILWGKRVRGYDNPFEQYGLDFRSASRVREFAMGLTGGVTSVLCIHSVNALLGFARLSWPPSLTPSSADALVLLNAYGSVLLEAVRGILQATCVAVVEELMFRSWLTEEVAIDLGYYRAVMLSGIAFSLVQRSLPSVPAFLLLSSTLFGIKQRANNKLSATIGVRAGIMSTNFFMRSGGFLTYPSNTPFWLSSIHLWHPFDGAVGLSFCAAMAILFFPRPPPPEENPERD